MEMHTIAKVHVLHRLQRIWFALVIFFVSGVTALVAGRSLLEDCCALSFIHLSTWCANYVMLIGC